MPVTWNYAQTVVGIKVGIVFGMLMAYIVFPACISAPSTANIVRNISDTAKAENISNVENISNTDCHPNFQKISVIEKLHSTSYLKDAILKPEWLEVRLCNNNSFCGPKGEVKGCCRSSNRTKEVFSIIARWPKTETQDYKKESFNLTLDYDWSCECQKFNETTGKKCLRQMTGEYNKITI